MKNLKKFLFAIVAAALFISFLLPGSGQAQVINAATKKKIRIGIGLANDFWMNKPDDMTTRAINQGVQVVGAYNMPLGKSNFAFAIGLGLTVNNLFWNYRFQGDSLNFQFVKIEDSLSYTRSKLSMPYLEIPIEFHLKTNNKISAGIGFKIGYMIYAHAKYIGDDYLFKGSNTLKASFKGIKSIERFSYGPTLRVGYKWFNVTAYYSLSKIFEKGKGPDMYPISVGFILMPF